MKDFGNIQCNGLGPGYIATPQTAPLRERQADGSRNYVFGINVVNMHNNQYGEATLFKYIVHPSLHTVYRFAPDGQLYQINPGTNEFNMFKAAWKEVYGTDFAFPDVNAVPATVNVHA